MHRFWPLLIAALFLLSGCMDYIFQMPDIPTLPTRTPTRTLTMVVFPTPATPTPPKQPDPRVIQDVPEVLVAWNHGIDLDVSALTDTMQENGVDISFSPLIPGTQQQPRYIRLTLGENALVALQGAYTQAPTFGQCYNTHTMMGSIPCTAQGAGSSCGGVTAARIAPQGYTLCLRTGEGNWGYFHVIDIDPDSGMKLGWRIWQAPAGIALPGDFDPQNEIPAQDSAAFIDDVTIPDGQVLHPGEVFHKVWRLKNDGTTLWNPNYALVYGRGDRMAGNFIIPLDASVTPGQEINLAVDLVAPQEPGVYTGYWMLSNDIGTLFGLGADRPFYVKIVVGQ